jgi:hypothetical protein
MVLITVTEGTFEMKATGSHPKIIVGDGARP